MTSKVSTLKLAISGERFKRTPIYLHEFQQVLELTKDESDFPRKLLKYYNINSKDKLTAKDVRLLANIKVSND